MMFRAYFYLLAVGILTLSNASFAKDGESTRQDLKFYWSPFLGLGVRPLDSSLQSTLSPSLGLGLGVYDRLGPDLLRKGWLISFETLSFSRTHYALGLRRTMFDWVALRYGLDANWDHRGFYGNTLTVAAGAFFVFVELRLGTRWQDRALMGSLALVFSPEIY